MPIKLFKRNANFLRARNGTMELRREIKKHQKKKSRQNMHTYTHFDVCLTTVSNSALSCGIVSPLGLSHNDFN